MFAGWGLVKLRQEIAVVKRRLAVSRIIDDRGRDTTDAVLPAQILDLIGTKRMFSLVTASVMASASRNSSCSTFGRVLRTGQGMSRIPARVAHCPESATRRMQGKTLAVTAQ